MPTEVQRNEAVSALLDLQNEKKHTSPPMKRVPGLNTRPSGDSNSNLRSQHQSQNSLALQEPVAGPSSQVDRYQYRAISAADANSFAAVPSTTHCMAATDRIQCDPSYPQPNLEEPMDYVSIPPGLGI